MAQFATVSAPLFFFLLLQCGGWRCSGSKTSRIWKTSASHPSPQPPSYVCLSPHSESNHNKSECRYFTSLLYLTLTLTVLTLSPLPTLLPSLYYPTLGYLGLLIEATLPIPQLLANASSRSCAGFRLSVIANWLIGDAFKMSYFFLGSEPVPWPFKLCGLFQAACDLGLGYQFWVFGAGSAAGPGAGVLAGKVG